MRNSAQRRVRVVLIQARAGRCPTTSPPVSLAGCPSRPGRIRAPRCPGEGLFILKILRAVLTCCNFIHRPGFKARNRTAALRVLDVLVILGLPAKTRDRATQRLELYRVSSRRRRWDRTPHPVPLSFSARRAAPVRACQIAQQGTFPDPRTDVQHIMLKTVSSTPGLILGRSRRKFVVTMRGTAPAVSTEKSRR